MIGEGFAFFRWRVLNIELYIIDACKRHPNIINGWPPLAQWRKLQQAA